MRIFSAANHRDDAPAAGNHPKGLSRGRRTRISDIELFGEGTRAAGKRVRVD